MSDDDWANPPQHDEFEISIFGPGRGESIVLHLGNNEWAVVDSCVPRGTSEPAALTYLRSLGVDVARQLRFVLATHWHDDHIRGLSRLLEEAPAASFACSTALQRPEFLQVVGQGGDPVNPSAGVREMALVLEHLAARASSVKPNQRTTPMYAIESRTLLTLQDSGRPFPLRILALSPSDTTVEVALREIAQLIQKPGAALLDLPSQSPNHASVVVWVEAGDRRALLGADLEQHANSERGWFAVLNAHSDPVRGTIFKVPHHGSVNADCPDVWSKVLERDVVALLAPYNGGQWLPKQADRERIARRTKNAFCTASQPLRPPRRSNFVEKLIKQSVRSRRAVVGQPGQVRVRCSTNNSGSAAIKLFNGAYRISPKTVS